MWLNLLQDNMMLALMCAGVLGLCVGSFLNVVIHRMPQMMLFEWRRDCSQLLSDQADIDPNYMTPIQRIIDQDTALTLSLPRSSCPNCGHQIKWFENIPVISWLILRGKCSSCHQPISGRYPLVEIITALLSAAVVYKLGVGIQSLLALILVWTLIALAGIDFDTQLLPDRLTFPLAGLGLAVNTQGWFVTPTQSIWGLLLGFLSLWVVVKLFYLITKKHGMGAGDFKLLAALGAWLGPMMLPLIILLSSVIGAIVGIILIRRHGESRPFAFGPYIAIAGVIAVLFGPAMVDWYLHLYV